MKDSGDRSYDAYVAEAHMLWPYWTLEEVDLRYKEALRKERKAVKLTNLNIWPRFLACFRRLLRFLIYS